jgi:hypothetical protein
MLLCRQQHAAGTAGGAYPPATCCIDRPNALLRPNKLSGSGSPTGTAPHQNSQVNLQVSAEHSAPEACLQCLHLYGDPLLGRRPTQVVVLQDSAGGQGMHRQKEQRMLGCTGPEYMPTHACTLCVTNAALHLWNSLPLAVWAVVHSCAPTLWVHADACCCACLSCIQHVLHKNLQAT